MEVLVLHCGTAAVVAIVMERRAARRHVDSEKLQSRRWEAFQLGLLTRASAISPRHMGFLYGHAHFYSGHAPFCSGHAPPCIFLYLYE